MKVFSKRHARWAVRLSCGHDRLISDANYFAGWVICKQCPPEPDRPNLWGKSIVYRWGLRAVTCHG